MNHRTQLLATATYGTLGGMCTVFIIAIIGQSGGCKGTPYTSHDPTHDIRDADRSFQKIPGRADKIDEHAVAIEKATPKKKLLDIIRDVEGIKGQTAIIREDVADGSAALVSAKAETIGLRNDLTTAQGRLKTEQESHADDLDHWYVHWGRPIDRFLRMAWWLAVLVIGGGFVLRIVGMFAGGWVGATVAKVGSIGLHFLPVVGGIVNQFFDNAFFRQRQFHLEAPKPTPPVSVVVEEQMPAGATLVNEPQTMQVAPQPLYTSTTTRTTTRKPVKRKK